MISMAVHGFCMALAMNILRVDMGFAVEAPGVGEVLLIDECNAGITFAVEGNDFGFGPRER